MKPFVGIVVLLALAMLPVTVEANFISPTSASLSGGNHFDGQFAYTHDQSGLSAPEGTATHEAFALNGYAIIYGGDWTLTYELGASYDATAFYLWDNDDDFGKDDLASFRLDFFSGGSLVGTTGTLASPPADGSAPINVEAYSISASNIDRFDLVWLSAYGSNVSIDEVALEATPASTAPIPEPTTIVLMGFGILGLVGYVVRRKRRK
ncbi:PEP-CTERM sorting domain-containing protein [bacterium]|nr:PEP-CTERM sorting domain-containing protein [bacterium]